MKKPTKKTKEFYDYNEVVDYIEKKYKLEERKSGDDFWKWLCENHDWITNGCFFDIEFGDEFYEPTENSKQILSKIQEEFARGEDSLEVWIEW